MEESKQIEVPGNPVIDIMYYALSKFGSKVHFSSKDLTFFMYSDNVKEIVRSTLIAYLFSNKTFPLREN